MIDMYCKAKHHPEKDNCSKCDALRQYAFQRLEKCAYGEEKTTCASCPIHCYKADKREQIRQVMRFAGPRMLFKHPWLTIQHFYKEYTRKRRFESKHSSKTIST